MRFFLFGTGFGANYGTHAAIIGTEKILHHSFPGSEIWIQHLSWRSPNYDDVSAISNDIVIKSGGKGIRIGRFCRRLGEKTGLLERRVVTVPKGLVEQSDCVLSIGGDLYTFANKEKNWPFPFPIMEAGNKIMRLGKPYVIWCASVGPFDKAGNRLGELVDHLHSCKAVILREQDSYNYLYDGLGLKDNVYLSADPAFLMDPKPFDCPFITRRNGEKLLAVNFCSGPMQHVFGHKKINVFQAELIPYIRKLLDELDIRILLVPHLPGNKFLTPIYKQLKKKYSERIQILPSHLGSPKTKWAISQANALLTMRFHCALAGFSTNTPTMILVSTTKGEKICKEMYGDLEYALKIKNMNAEAVVSKVKKMLDNEKSIRARLKPTREQMEKRALTAGDVLAKVTYEI